jgi:feruloyl esterase
MQVCSMLHKFALLSAGALTAAAQTPCERLKSLSLPHTTITAADSMPAQAASPAHCRVEATLRPSTDSDIKIVVQLPAANWNGKYEAVGNGGWAGTINDTEMAAALRRGYATSSTDTGHSSQGASFAMGHPEKLVDFGYRSEHEMTVTAKAIITAFYAAGPKFSYFVGCSSGGRQALMESQRFPDDYDGIAAGAPTNNWNNMMFGRIWVAQATLKDPASYIPPAKYPAIHKAVMEACDALDGVRDGVLEDPTRCRFDPGAIACKGADGPACLTAPQVEAARKIYTPAANSQTGKQIFPAMERGSELVWGTLAGGPKPIALANDYFKYVVFENPDWDFKTLNFGSDVAKGEKRDGGTLSATNPDLRRFFAHGGKLIQYHGWTDQQVMPRNSIDYYNSVVKYIGDAAKTAESYRLFMAPGMGHCGGGEGPNKFDVVGVLAQWVEEGKAPDSMLAQRNEGDATRTRPLCPYPQVAVYKGAGSTDDAANFACKQP